MKGSWPTLPITWVGERIKFKLDLEDAKTLALEVRIAKRDLDVETASFTLDLGCAGSAHWKGTLAFGDFPSRKRLITFTKTLRVPAKAQLKGVFAARIDVLIDTLAHCKSSVILRYRDKRSDGSVNCLLEPWGQPPKFKQRSCKEFTLDRLAFGSYADFILESEDGVSFNCHRLVLAHHCSVFKTMFGTDCKEVTEGKIVLSGFASDTVSSFLDFMYKGPLNFEPTLDLLRLGHMYQMNELVGAAAVIIESKITEGNVLDVLSTALFLNIRRLAMAAQHYMTTCLMARKPLRDQLEGYSPEMKEMLKSRLDTAQEYIKSQWVEKSPEKVEKKKSRTRPSKCSRCDQVHAHNKVKKQL